VLCDNDVRLFFSSFLYLLSERHVAAGVRVGAKYFAYLWNVC